MTTVRSALVGDVPDVLALWERAAGPTRHAGGRSEAERLLERDPGALLVAESDGRIVGTLVVGWDGWRCHLYRLAVEETARRSGTASALVAESRRRARLLGAVQIDAMVHRQNVGAAAFWESAGFSPDTDDARWTFPL
jgi:ribosomal protein S18 acetylase RimI-like enzyme